MLAKLGGSSFFLPLKVEDYNMRSEAPRFAEERDIFPWLLFLSCEGGLFPSNWNIPSFSSADRFLELGGTY